MSPLSNSALVLLKPGLMRSPMMLMSKPSLCVTRCSLERSLREADLCRNAFWKSGARAELDVAAGASASSAARARAPARRQHAAHADAGGVADLHEALARQIREQPDGDAAATSM